MSNKKIEFLIAVIIIAIIAAVSYIAIQRNNSNIASNAKNPVGALSKYIDQQYGFQIIYPATLSATSTFSSSYLLPNSWNVNAKETAGDQIVDIIYPESNEVLSAEIRIGGSAEPAGVGSCFSFDKNFATSTLMINGIRFVRSISSDAAMSHFSNITSFRTLHNGACIAIDEVIYGTNPDVYDPPRSLPFDKILSGAILDNVVASFTFIK